MKQNRKTPQVEGKRNSKETYFRWKMDGGRAKQSKAKNVLIYKRQNTGAILNMQVCVCVSFIESRQKNECRYNLYM